MAVSAIVKHRGAYSSYISLKSNSVGPVTDDGKSHLRILRFPISLQRFF